MIPYEILITMVIVVQILKYNKMDIKFKSLSVLDALLLLAFWIFYSMRYNVGFDYQSYVSLISNHWYEVFAETKMEYLSYFFMDIAYGFNDPQIFFMLIAGFALPLYFYSFSHYSEVKNALPWALLVFLALPIGFMYSLSISRQFAASAIILWGTRYLINRCFFKYFLCVSVASFFHVSSFFAICGYIITLERFRLKYFPILGSVMLGLILLVKSIVISIFPMYEKYLQMTLGDQSSGMPQVILYSLFCIMFVFIRRCLYKNMYYDIYLKLYIFGIICCYCLIPLDPEMGIRLGLFGLLYACFLMPYTFLLAKSSYTRLLLYVFAISCILILFFYGLIVAGDAYIPYQTVL